MADISDRVRIEDETVLSRAHYVLKKVRYSWRRGDGSWQKSTREVYDRGDGAAILLCNPAKRTVVLTRQLRIPAYLNGYRGLMIEAAAGVLDGEAPEKRICEEAEEETGYRPRNVRKVFELFMSPGAVTERLHLFLGEYDAADRSGAGGGLKAEGEDIDVLELPFVEAMAMAADGRICDAKTVVLLQYAALNLFGGDGA